MKRALFPFVVVTLLIAFAASSHDDSKPPLPSQASLMRELHACLNVERSKAVPADVLSSCRRKNAEALVGVSRDDLFTFLGEPSYCRRADGSITSITPCRAEDSAGWSYYPSCRAGPSFATGLLFTFTSAGVVSQARWEECVFCEGIVACIPEPR